LDKGLYLIPQKIPPKRYDERAGNVAILLERGASKTLY